MPKFPKKGINARYLPRLRSDLYLDNSYLQQLDIKEGIRFDKKTLTVLFFISKYTAHSHAGVAFMKQQTILNQLWQEFLPSLSINTLKVVIKKLIDNNFIITQTYQGKKGYKATVRAIDLFKEILEDFSGVFDEFSLRRFSRDYISQTARDKREKKIFLQEYRKANNLPFSDNSYMFMKSCYDHLEILDSKFLNIYLRQFNEHALIDDIGFKQRLIEQCQMYTVEKSKFLTLNKIEIWTEKDESTGLIYEQGAEYGT